MSRIKEIDIDNKCSICGGELFENEYKDIQCEKCRAIIPFNKTNWWEPIKETEDFIIEYNKTKEMYRVSYFENNHFVDDVIFNACKPVIHGEWIIIPFKPEHEWDTVKGYPTYKCSLCGRVERVKEPYCNCGARMDGGNSND